MTLIYKKEKTKIYDFVKDINDTHEIEYAFVTTKKESAFSKLLFFLLKIFETTISHIDDDDIEENIISFAKKHLERIDEIFSQKLYNNIDVYVSILYSIINEKNIDLFKNKSVFFCLNSIFPKLEEDGLYYDEQNIIENYFNRFIFLINNYGFDNSVIDENGFDLIKKMLNILQNISNKLSPDKVEESSSEFYNILKSCFLDDITLLHFMLIFSKNVTCEFICTTLHDLFNISKHEIEEDEFENAYHLFVILCDIYLESNLIFIGSFLIDVLYFLGMKTHFEYFFFDFSQKVLGVLDVICQNIIFIDIKQTNFDKDTLLISFFSCIYYLFLRLNIKYSFEDDENEKIALFYEFLILIYDSKNLKYMLNYIANSEKYFNELTCCFFRLLKLILSDQKLSTRCFERIYPITLMYIESNELNFSKNTRLNLIVFLWSISKIIAKNIEALTYLTNSSLFEEMIQVFKFIEPEIHDNLIDEIYDDVSSFISVVKVYNIDFFEINIKDKLIHSFESDLDNQIEKLRIRCEFLINIIKDN